MSDEIDPIEEVFTTQQIADFAEITYKEASRLLRNLWITPLETVGRVKYYSQKNADECRKYVQNRSKKHTKARKDIATNGDVEDLKQLIHVLETDLAEAKIELGKLRNNLEVLRNAFLTIKKS